MRLAYIIIGSMELPNNCVKILQSAWFIQSCKILIQQVEFDLEQEKSCWILRHLHLKCNTVYHPKSNEMTSPKRTRDSYFGIVRKLLGRLWHYFNMLQWFEKDYTYHAEIAKELKQRNDEIYNTVSTILVITCRIWCILVNHVYQCCAAGIHMHRTVSLT